MKRRPPQLDAEIRLAHRSPTYAIELPDGRTLELRREADIRDARLGINRKVALAHSGPVHWWARCEDREATGQTLAVAIFGAAGCERFPDVIEQLRALLRVSLAIAERRNVLAFAARSA